MERLKIRQLNNLKDSFIRISKFDTKVQRKF